jgi:hypothetical protein
MNMGTLTSSNSSSSSSKAACTWVWQAMAAAAWQGSTRWAPCSWAHQAASQAGRVAAACGLGTAALQLAGVQRGFSIEWREVEGSRCARWVQVGQQG